ncbi:MAG: N-glycosylase/DNA lyase [Synergistetes bacterium]|nr:N-glycosylase/DNA lyase [Synergistota bacterium]
MDFSSEHIYKIKLLHRELLQEIKGKLESFKEIWTKRDDERMWEELVFCLLTPQSKAEMCWRVVENLRSKGLLFKGSVEEICRELSGIRFRNRKAEYIVDARNFFFNFGKPAVSRLLESVGSPFEMREWLVSNVKGMGYKEASHFLRNIGLGEDMAILDRHILKCMMDIGLLDKLPLTMSKRGYLRIEDILRKFSEDIGIALSHLDFVFWYLRTGRIFK